MSLTRRALIGQRCRRSPLPLRAAPRAQAAPALKIGVLTDLSGPYKDIGGPLSTDCARLAAARFRRGGEGLNVEFVSADHQNKPDVGAGIARQWFDRDGVDVILDVPNSGGRARGFGGREGEEQGLPESATPQPPT